MDRDAGTVLPTRAGDHRTGQQAWLWAGTVAVALSVGLQLPGTGMAHRIGYVLGTFVAIFMVALYRRSDRRASASPWYSPRPPLDRLAFAVLLVGIASAVLHAYFIAVEVAR